ncbi:MAG: hypothetical protein PHS04_00490 [Tissierellia bacterium]|nr:hypothetical protein [Tissierellia bacterium]
MAYMNQEMKKKLAPKIKEVCKKYGVKATLAVDRHSTLVLNVRSGKIDFSDYLDENRTFSIKYFKIVNSDHKDEKSIAKKFIEEVRDAMNIGNWNNSDIMTDYFDVGWYVEVNIGKWDKPYKFTP